MPNKERQKGYRVNLAEYYRNYWAIRVGLDRS